jgi:hypothetical protein
MRSRGGGKNQRNHHHQDFQRIARAVSDDTKESSLSGSWLATFFLAGCLTLAGFILEDVLMGGSAQNGKLEDRKYYVGAHGKYTEVSKVLFEFSRAHFYFTLLVFVPSLLAALLSRKEFSGSLLRGHSPRQWIFAASLPLFWLMVFLCIRLAPP